MRLIPDVFMGVQNAFQYVQDAVQKAHQSGELAYDEATLKQIAEDWRDIAEECRDGLRNAQKMRNVRGPGLDAEGSGYFEAKAQPSGEAFYQSLQDQVAYAEAQAEKVETALGIFSENDKEVGDAFAVFGFEDKGEWKGPL